MNQALRRDDSLFTPGSPIWKSSTLDDLHRRFVEQPDLSKDSFSVKFKRQLQGYPPETYQLAAEMLYIHVIIAGDMHPNTKRRLVENVLSWSSSPVSIPLDLDEVLERGLVNSGIAFKTYRPFQLTFLLAFARRWKALMCTPLIQDLAVVTEAA